MFEGFEHVFQDLRTAELQKFCHEEKASWWLQLLSFITYN
jgi:hypothetical protein